MHSSLSSLSCTCLSVLAAVLDPCRALFLRDCWQEERNAFPIVTSFYDTVVCFLCRSTRKDGCGVRTEKKKSMSAAFASLGLCLCACVSSPAGKYRVDPIYVLRGVRPVPGRVAAFTPTLRVSTLSFFTCNGTDLSSLRWCSSCCGFFTHDGHWAAAAAAAFSQSWCSSSESSSPSSRVSW